MAFTGKFVYIWFPISSCYGSVPLALGLIGRFERSLGGIKNTPFLNQKKYYLHQMRTVSVHNKIYTRTKNKRVLHLSIIAHAYKEVL